LLTDAASPDVIPPSIRSAADEVQCGSLLWDKESQAADPFDAALVWCRGESPKAGSAADWRRPFFSRPDRDTWVAVHWPCLEHADLIGIEPRLLRPESTAASWNPALRISGSNPSEKRKTNWRATEKPWARLSAALCAELENPSSAIDPLLQLWNSNMQDARFSSLILRNMIVILMKQKRWQKAGEILDLGEKAFPGYAEMAYLHAVFFLEQQSPAKAIRFLESALGGRAGEFVGSGGENSFRARYLLGLICDSVGQQEKAFNFWISCALEQPAFAPAVRALTAQRIPRTHAVRLHYPLAEMARREPQYLEAVVDFFLAHRMARQARRLVETMAIENARRETLLDKIGRAEFRSEPRPRPAPEKPGPEKPGPEKPGIVLTGSIFDASGHARINRAVGLAAIRSPHFEASLDPTTWPTLLPKTLEHGAMLQKAASRQIGAIDLTIRHQWPPDFERPASGKLVCILPWEHKAVPIRWIEEIEEKVDEVWTPSDFARDSFLVAGLSADRIRMIPNAVDGNIFRPDGPASRPPNSRGFVFLFVGGPIRRKGIDMLLQAYGDAFLPDEDVTLVIKDLGSRSFYSHNTQLGKARQFALRPSSPHTLLVTEELDDAALAALYRGADAFVLPYRAEGFGMPLIEAMACGKPVITTGEGPATEFCSAENSYLIRAAEVSVPDPVPPLGPLSSEWTWFEPDVAALAQTMRHVYEDRDEAAARGRKAAAVIQRSLAWERILPLYLERMARLVGMVAPVSKQI
jgi:glycosyltransferase involved in cell wall biosynthesis